MSDPLRTDPSQQNDGASAAERTAKIEQLLLAGLDHYFAAEYEQAVNIWTRALFLDRGHARARAYIERARGALAERQRQSEELLHDGLAAFQRGEGSTARKLLQTALTSGAPPEVALAALDRIDRLEQTTAPVAIAEIPDRPAAGEPVVRARVPRSSVRWVTLALALVGAVTIVIVVRSQWRSWWADDAVGPVASPVATAQTMLPLPRRGETALARARAFVARGHLREAIVELEAIKATDPERGDADRLRSDLQRQLIAMSESPSSVSKAPKTNP